MSNLAMAMETDKYISALVVDLADMSCFEATAYGLTEKGCWIASDKVDLLKEEVGLRLAGFEKLIRGTVVAYGDQEAQISFQIKKQEPGEKRREIRRQVWITTIVCGKTNAASMKCRIVDASKSGCRLEGDKLDKLPDEIEISIPGLDLPIKGAIVWRKNNQAGVKLDWPFEPAPEPKPEDILKFMKAEEEKPKPKPRKKISAFGS
ncbi:PilZ domain-containing protein [Roseibium sp. M-1]